MIFKLCTVAIVLVVGVSAYPAEDIPTAVLLEAKQDPAESASRVILPEADDIDQPAAAAGDEEENLKGAESGWGGWGWGGRGHGWGGYGGWGHGYGHGHHGWGRGYGGGWGGYGGHGGWYGGRHHYWG